MPQVIYFIENIKENFEFEIQNFPTLDMHMA